MPAAGSPWPRLGGVKITLQRAIQLYIDQWFEHSTSVFDVSSTSRIAYVTNIIFLLLAKIPPIIAFFNNAPVT